MVKISEKLCQPSSSWSLIRYWLKMGMNVTERNPVAKT